MWGAATAAYQIEGAWNEDGKGPSVWDEFSHQPGHIANNDHGDTACDHYHRMPEDVQLIKSLGINNYRFSISWPRIFPEGKGQPNPAGVDFYDRLLDELAKNGITPFVTLNHWDLPQALQEHGGWANRELVDIFTDYAEFIFKKFNDRVRLWSTHNEPWVIAYFGYGEGNFAPGIKDYAQAYQAGHHLLLSHGKAVQAFRQGGYQGQIGIVLNLAWTKPASSSEKDIQANRRAYLNDWSFFLDPLIKGAYPDELFDWIGPMQPKIEVGDLALIKGSLDYLGINHYNSSEIFYDENGGHLKKNGIQISAPNTRLTDMGWGVYADGFKNLLLDIKQNYGNPPVIISENGCAVKDQVSVDGKVHDIERISYLESYLNAIYEAIQAGVDLKGYFVWSLMDNFEWASGYDKRFGIVYTDYKSLKRIPKDSAWWFKNIIRNNGF